MNILLTKNKANIKTKDAGVSEEKGKFVQSPKLLERELYSGNWLSDPVKLFTFIKERMQDNRREVEIMRDDFVSFHTKINLKNLAKVRRDLIKKDVLECEKGPYKDSPWTYRLSRKRFPFQVFVPKHILAFHRHFDDEKIQNDDETVVSIDSKRTKFPHTPSYNTTLLKSPTPSPILQKTGSKIAESFTLSGGKSEEEIKAESLAKFARQRKELGF